MMFFSRRFPIRHKFNAIRTELDGISFPSRREAEYYVKLKMRMRQGGDVLFFLRQVPLHLPGGIRYLCDFQVFKNDGSVEFVEVKGFPTREWLTKKKMVESLYPIKITVVK